MWKNFDEEAHMRMIQICPSEKKIRYYRSTQRNIGAENFFYEKNLKRQLNRGALCGTKMNRFNEVVLKNDLSY